MARLPIPGQDAGAWGDLLNDFLRVSHAESGAIKSSAISSKTDKATLTAKGDLYAATGSGAPDRLSVGGDGQVLAADSTQSTGLRWIDPATEYSREINSVSSSTEAGNDPNTDYVYLVSGTTTITLPTAVDNLNCYTVTNVGGEVVNVGTTESQTINGSASVTIAIQNMSLDFVSDNSNWVIK